MFAPLDRRELRELADVRARDEGLLPRPGHDETAQARVGARRRDGALELAHDLGVQRIQLFRALDRDRANRLRGLDPDKIAHFPSPYS